MSSDQTPITSQRHNEFVGSDANANRIPGADKATTGHHYISIFPKEGAPQQSSGERRAEEHLPPPTGRDRPPRGLAHTRPAEQGGPTERLTTVRQQTPPHQQPQPLDPAPDSRTVIDRDPFAEPISAGDTLTGATSEDVYSGIGHPGGGMTSKELHHDGHAHRKRATHGTHQYGTGEEIFEQHDQSNMRR